MTASMPKGGARVELRGVAVQYPGAQIAAVHDVDLVIDTTERSVAEGADAIADLMGVASGG